MSQHDFEIENQGFPAFRADLNNALAALASNSAGATEPSTTFAYQFWLDTSASPNVLKQRNADNDAWVTIGTIDQATDAFNLAVAQGGTGSSTGAGALVNLGERTSATGAVVLATGTTGERDGSPSAGYIRFNTTLSQFEGYNGSAWGAIGGGATGGGSDATIFENDQAITADYTLTSGKNGMSAGAITINSGVTLTIPSGSRYVVI